MNTRSMFFFLVVLIFVMGSYAQERGPIAISPGSDAEIAFVAQSCPTFSWTAVEWAAAYKVLVFETNGPNVLAYEEMEAIASPILHKEIQGRALSWTPSSEEGLVMGGMYVWYVQAVNDYGQGEWSEGKMFRIDAGLRYQTVEERVSRRLKKQGLSDEVIEDVLEDIRLGGEEMIASDLAPSEVANSQTLFHIQTIEGETADNTYFGLGAGAYLTTGFDNTFIGRNAGYWNTSGKYNTFVGHEAGYKTSYYYGNVGEDNTFVGSDAGYENLYGDFNTFIGRAAGKKNTTGRSNTFVGYIAGLNNTTGRNNTFVGRESGNYNTTGNYNVFLGHNAGHYETGSYKLYIDPPELEISADEELIEQVIINLVKNSIHALENRKDPKITMDAHLSKRGRPTIQVSDNGTGILQEVIDKIFIPFFTTKPKGSGIGLSLSRQILRLHGGTISAQSVPEEGTTFTLTF